MRLQVVFLIAGLIVVNASRADTRTAESSLEALARKASSSDPAESATALTLLRAAGPSGLDAFLSTHAAELEREPLASEAQLREWYKLASALDALCQQHDCYASRLYWYTDFEQAKAAARASGKPILSLRLLGRLDEDLSCANSRFFRIALYANGEVSRFLRDNFVLHWKSVRPVPKVTIDFGDGRKLERTLTGNSIHYVLDQDGRPVDALPGLYGPQAFLRELKRAQQAVAECSSAPTRVEHETRLRRYHQTRLTELASSWAADTAGLAKPPSREVPRRAGSQSDPPSAVEAAPKAVAKMLAIERPILRGFSTGTDVLERSNEDAVWSSIAQLRIADARMDDNSRALMRNKAPGKLPPLPAAEAFERAVRNLESLIAEDTARNEYVFHTQIHTWFASGLVNGDVDNLNERVYSTLFLTPSSDPWLGLLPRDSFSGIDNNGVLR